MFMSVAMKPPGACDCFLVILLSMPVCAHRCYLSLSFLSLPHTHSLSPSLFLSLSLCACVRVVTIYVHA